MNKEDKRKLNYKTFCSRLESNLFKKKYVGETSEKTKVLKCLIAFMALLTCFACK
jgi:hypothetical protein